jgi:GDPmannose 4,6-dehydratase
MYGGVSAEALHEATPFHPRSPYGVAKVAAYYQTINYREAYGIFASNGILFNHESPRRGETFVTRKITRGLAAVLAGQAQHLYLGNLDARRDWGFAGDYVEGIWRMLQHHQPDDFVLATGETHSVRTFLELCCGMLGLDPEAIVRIDPRYYRPSEVDVLLGDASKAERVLGWKAKTTLQQLAALMLHSDLKLAGVDPERFANLLLHLPGQ